MKLLPFLFSCEYSKVKLFVLAMNSRRRYSIFVCFIHGLEEKNSKSEVAFAVCRLPLTSCLTSTNCQICYAAGRAFTTPDVSLNIPESVLFTDYVKRVFTSKIIITFHFGNLRRARARINQIE